MTSLAELCRAHTPLGRDEVDHLNRLTAEWTFLADLCFADLLLRVQSGEGKWLIVDQVRPATNQTMYTPTSIGTWADAPETAVIDEAAALGTRVERNVEGGADETQTRMLADPRPLRRWSSAC